MAAYRCAFCGSPNVIKNENNAGFSYKKALVGTAVFGTVGAVAGINGKKTIEYVCPDCGHTSPNPMDAASQDMADVVLALPPQVALKTSPTFINRYIYIKRELEQLCASSLSQINAPNGQYANPTNITEAEFRAAAARAKQMLEKFDKYRFDHNPKNAQRVESRKKIHAAQGKKYTIANLDIAQAKQAIRDFGIIYQGVAAFPHLVMDSYSSALNSGLDCSNLANASLFYILSIYNELSVSELFDLSQTEETMQRVFYALMGNKWTEKLEERRRHSSYMNFEYKNEILPKKTWIETLKSISSSNDNYRSFKISTEPGFKESTTLAVPFIVRDNVLYMRDYLSPDERFEVDMPTVAEKMKENQREYNSITIPQQKDFHSEATEAMYRHKISDLNNSISVIEANIGKLSKKIFGKAKAQTKIAELQEQIEKQKKEIEKFKAEIELVQKEENERFSLAKTEADQKREVLKTAYAELTKEKDSYIAQYSIWIDVMTLPDVVPDME